MKSNLRMIKKKRNLFWKLILTVVNGIPDGRRGHFAWTTPRFLLVQRAALEPARGNTIWVFMAIPYNGMIK